MLFTTPVFLVFFAGVVIAYYALPRRFQAPLLILASCLFYAYFSLSYFFIFCALVLFTFLLAQEMEKSSPARRKNLLIFGIILNLSPLVLYRYVIFPDANVAALGTFLDWNYGAGLLSLLWPIGLSYLVFQSISYLVEIQRGTYTAERQFLPFFSYMLFFPKLLAGPIERPAHLLPQLKQGHAFDGARLQRGLERMLWGFFKKLVIADNVALLVAHIYATLPQADGPALVLLAVLYPFQMYADVSGYTDIALGAALVFGIELSENFNRPFSSHSISEYWRRWHISISTWFRDCVYFPLAYSKEKTTARGYAALFATFLVSGLWHGATWTFLASGLINATNRVLDPATVGVRARVWSVVDAFGVPRLSGTLQIILTFCLMAISLVFFGAPSIQSAWFVLTHMTSGLGQLLHILYIHDQLLTVSSIGITLYTFVGIVVAIVVMELVQLLAARGHLLDTYPRYVRWGAYVAVLLAIVYVGNLAPVPFIYFRF